MADIDIHAFCWALEGRENIAEPIHQGVFTFATNGQIMIRVARRDDLEGAEFLEDDGLLIHQPSIDRIMQHVPNCAFIMKPAVEFSGEWTALPPNLVSRMERRVECDECYGNGVVTCSKCHHDSECEECHGECMTWNFTPVPFGDYAVAYWLYALIADLPNVQYGHYDVGNGLIVFRFTGGIGLVAKVRGEDGA